MKWPECFEDDLYFECHLFEQIGYVPFEPYFGYHYRIRQGSICHSDRMPERVIGFYEEAIAQLESNGMGLEAATRDMLTRELARRIENIGLFLADQTSGNLAYEPKVLIDVLHYPQGAR